MLHDYLSGPVHDALQSFVLAHETDDERKLVLKHKVIHGVPAALVANQISGRRKAKTKLPSYYRNPAIYYPPSINVEQSSSEITAHFKAKLLQETARSGAAGLNTGVDLTGGLGVDAFFLSRACDALDYVEADPALLEIARHNHRVLGATTIRYHAMTAETFVATAKQKFNFAYIDPSRRKNTRKVFRLADSEPNIVEMIPSVFELADWILVKASPLLDLQQGIEELKTVHSIYVVAVDDECREVLFLCSKSGSETPLVTAINFTSRPDGDQKEFVKFTFTLKEEKAATVPLSDPLTYLYEPHSWILKSGAFKIVGHRYGLFKLQVNTHLYTSDQKVDEFPGRIFKIENGKLDPRKLNAHFPGGKANVFVRNYPLSPEALKKKLRLKDGGIKYLIGCSGVHEKFLVAATRVK
jgi:THUMP domain-like